MIRILRGVVRVLFVLVILVAIGAGALVGVTLSYFGRDLPDVKQIADYVPAVGSKVYAGDGTFLAEFESEHRIPVTIDKVPQIVIEAFLAAEDRDFYKHNGVNPVAMFRAAFTDILRLPRGQRPIGASTITQQVVRHFLLTNEVSISRKIKEALLAYRIDHELSKNRILEIYLNEIYLGAGSYGVAAAADTYFHKPLDQLTVAEAATLAALPKAPNNYNPFRHPRAAQARRDWVLSGMAEVGWITQAQAKAATAEPLDVVPRSPAADAQTAELDGYFVEEVRRELIARYGEKTVYQGGLTVRTSYSRSYQQMAETAFRDGLIAYDRRHGWRGPVARYSSGAAAQMALTGMADPPGIASWQLAAVTATDSGGATISLKDGGQGRIPLSELRWARRTLDDQRLGSAVRRVGDVLQPGDVVIVEPTGAAAKGRHAYRAATYALRQIPNVSGGVVVEDPKTGRIFALVGGWSFRQSQFDRATQAMRQPGSSFKPFVYVTALENGFTPDSTVDDAPVSVPQGPGLPAWQPANYESGYVGETTLADALIHSRNLATVHVALQIGLKPIAKTAENFGVMDKMPLYYSMVLGAGTTTLTRMTTAYAMIDNGGHWLMSSLIDTVQDRSGRILYQKGVNGCAACFVSGGAHNGSDNNTLYHASVAADPSSIAIANASYPPNAMVYKPTKPDPLVTPEADWQLVQMMESVVQHGTGIAVAAVGKPLAGKTGTTSDWFDAWFVGFSPDVAAGVYVGFDEPRTLGGGEQGGHVAAPIFRDFMMAALKDKPAKDFEPPPGAEPVVANNQNDAAASTDDDGTAAPDSSGDAEQRWAGLGPDAGAYPPDAADNPPGTQSDSGISEETLPPPAQDDGRAPRRRATPGYDGYPAYPPVYGGPGYGPPGYPPRDYAQRDYPPTDGQADDAQPDNARSWGQGYGAGGYPPFPAPNYPRYPAPGWGMRPGAGTGGLY